MIGQTYIWFTVHTRNTRGGNFYQFTYELVSLVIKTRLKEDSVESHPNSKSYLYCIKFHESIYLKFEITTEITLFL